MWDQNTGRSRGYGFVAFRDKEDAEQAIREMNNVWLGTRAIRVNWANQKLMPKSISKPTQLRLEDVLSQASPTNTTVYVGNLAPEVTEPQLKSIFAEYGTIEEIRVQADKGYAFVRFQSHQSAANAIVGLHGQAVESRTIRCSWGKARFPTAAASPPPFLPPPIYGPVPYGPMQDQPPAYKSNKRKADYNQDYTEDNNSRYKKLRTQAPSYGYGPAVQGGYRGGPPPPPQGGPSYLPPPYMQPPVGQNRQYGPPPGNFAPYGNRFNAPQFPTGF